MVSAETLLQREPSQNVVDIIGTIMHVIVEGIIQINNGKGEISLHSYFLYILQICLV